MPPAEPTTATTCIGRGSAVGATRPRQEAADRLRLPAGLLGDLLEATAAPGGSRLADPLGELLAESRTLLQGADRRPQRVLDRLSLHFGRSVCVWDLEAHLSTAILAHLGLIRKPLDFCCDCRREPGEREDSIRPVVHDGVDGEARERRVVGILDEDATAALADRARSRDAVVPGAGEDHCDRPPAVRAR